MEILVIDDQDVRKPYYQNLESLSGFDFKLTFLKESDFNVGKLNLVMNYDLVLLDIVLTGNWKIDSNYVIKRIRDVCQEIPIVLITGHWEYTNNDQIEQLLAFPGLHPVPLWFYNLWTLEQITSMPKDFIPRQKFEGVRDTNIADLGRTLKTIISNKSRQLFLGRDENDSLYILQISDMQIGGNTVKGNSLEPSAIVDQVQRSCDSPDFIAITGDVTESGHPNEFSQASSWISDICEGFGWERPYKKLLLVPGNHDIFAPAFGICTTEYVRSNPDGHTMGNFKQTSSVKNLSIASECSLKNFQDFAYRLTGNRYWLDNGNCSWLDYSYDADGLCFWGFNSVVSHTYDSPFYGLPQADYYKDFRNQLKGRESLNSDPLVILLSHHSDLVEDEVYTTFSQARPQPRVLLSGHLHKSKFRHLDHLNLLLSVAPTSSLKASERVEDAYRGFSLIELKREKRKVVGIVYNSYVKIGNDWVSFNDSSREYTYDCGRWRLV